MGFVRYYYFDARALVCVYLCEKFSVDERIEVKQNTGRTLRLSEQLSLKDRRQFVKILMFVKIFKILIP